MENKLASFEKLKCVKCGRTLCLAYPVNGPGFEVKGHHDFKKDGPAIEIKCERNPCGKINFIKRLENDKAQEYYPKKEAANGL